MSILVRYLKGGDIIFEKLKELRKQKKLTCDDMAAILGLETRAAYSKKENGDVKFTLADAKKISDYMHMPIEDIFFDDEVS